MRLRFKVADWGRRSRHRCFPWILDPWMIESRTILEQSLIVVLTDGWYTTSFVDADCELSILASGECSGDQWFRTVLSTLLLGERG